MEVRCRGGRKEEIDSFRGSHDGKPNRRQGKRKKGKPEYHLGGVRFITCQVTFEMGKKKRKSNGVGGTSLGYDERKGSSISKVRGSYHPSRVKERKRKWEIWPSNDWEGGQANRLTLSHEKTKKTGGRDLLQRR